MCFPTQFEKVQLGNVDTAVFVSFLLTGWINLAWADDILAEWAEQAVILGGTS